MEAYDFHKEREWPSSEFIRSQILNSQYLLRQKPHPTVYFQGGVSYQPSIDYITLTIERISTTLTTGFTRPLCVSLLTADIEFKPGQPLKPTSYDTVAAFNLEPLVALQYYSGVKKEVERKNRFWRPHTILLLEEGGDIVDWVNFRNKANGIVVMRGDTGFNTKGDEIEISIDRIVASHTTTKSGHLRVRLLSSEGKFGDKSYLSSDSYEVAAEFILEPLLPGTEYENIRRKVQSLNHARRKQSILTLSQYDKDGFVICDWKYFPEEQSEGSAFFSGDIKYDMFADSVTLYVDKVACNKIYSGSLRVSLLTSDTKYMSEESTYRGFEYLTVASFSMEALSKGEFFKNISKKCAQQTKNMKKEIVAVLESSEGAKWKVEDWKNLGAPQAQSKW